MKFTGQIKIPDLDHPGVPAVVLIEENQTELLMQGESLGRWSLVDVRADRLISNAFSLGLGDEEVTFIADEPVDFAYRGVEEMATVWARYRTMTLPRRVVANRRSRSGTKPSRIKELRSAMVDNLTGGSIPKPEPTAPAKTVAPPSQPRPIPESEAVVPPVPREAATAPESGRPEPDSIPATRGDPGSDDSRDISTPAARAGEHLEPPMSKPELPSTFSEDVDSSSGSEYQVESVFKESVPWLTPGSKKPAQPEASSSSEDEAVALRDAVFAADEPEPIAEDAAAVEPLTPSHDAELPVPPAPPKHLDAPEAAPAAGGGSRQETRRFVVDLGAFEDEGMKESERSADVRPPEPALAGAVEKGGIMGAVKAAFVRGRPQHDHEYVVAPGGIGIIRHICTECGHISIGTAD